MRIVCIGGGPAGLYFASLAKLGDPAHDVTVVERNPAGVTYGWGVVFGEALLADLFRTDPVSAAAIAAGAAIWQDQHVCVGAEKPAHLGGYGYSIGRQRLLDILTERAVQLGVVVEFDRDVADPAAFRDADLIIACDGVHSRLRQQFADHFGTQIVTGGNKYIWLGTHRLFDAFTFGFEETEAGWMWFHGYRFDHDTSTFIAECSPATWQRMGFADRDPEQNAAALEGIFKRHLDGHGLIHQMPGKAEAAWLSFTGITNRTWAHDNLVLIGDAAHTAHFSIGSGTTLAMDDAIALAAALREHPAVPDALRAYHRRRLPGVLGLQAEAGNSARWFEHVEHNVLQDPVEFGYSMLRRRYAAIAPGEHSPRWRYGVYRATQYPTLRGVRQQITSVRRNLRARGRQRVSG
ncbi:MAG TPA: FAD-dependent monooxygenase [Kineosporiaceae bacterium]|nr:FAD-dependent monooxygenase [Kineosporiaceae bacterium]